MFEPPGTFFKGNAELRELKNQKEAGGSNFFGRVGPFENVNAGPHSLNKTMVPTVSTSCVALIKATILGNVIQARGRFQLFGPPGAF